MSQTLTDLKKAIKNTPGTGENVSIAEINSAFDKFDNNFVPACMIENTVTQSVPSSGLQKLVYNAIVYDSYAARSEGPMADLNNDQIIIRKTGMYYVEAKIWTTTVSATGVMSLGIYVNGSGIVMEQMAPGAQQITQRVGSYMPLTAGDLVIVNAIQTSGSARTYTKNTWPHGFCFSAVWVGNIVEV